jgi:GGDEF domain-containing protein
MLPMNPAGALSMALLATPAKTAPTPPPETERSLSLLVEGTAMNMLEVDHESYKAFRASVTKTALASPDRLPTADKLAAIKTILQEFERYRNGSEVELKNRQSSWRAVVSILFNELITSLGIDSASESAQPLTQMIGTLKTAQELQDFRTLLEDFLHPTGFGSAMEKASSLKVADRSTANDNAAGLRGGGVAVEQVKALMERGGAGFIALFRLSCLEIISERFGLDAVQDCIMAVSAYLTASLHADDQIYHWSDSSLLVILRGRANEAILTAELQRISAHNSEINIRIGERMVMLRIPLSFDITPIAKLRAAEDLYKLSNTRKDRW